MASSRTAEKTKFSIKDFSSKCNQMRKKLENSLIENFIFCEVTESHLDDIW